MMQSHIGCICLIFLHCVFSNVASSCLHQRMHNHIGCICLTFLHCVFSNVSLKHLHKKMHSHTGYISWTCFHCAFSNVSSNGLPERMQNHTDCICLTFLVYCPLFQQTCLKFPDCLFLFPLDLLQWCCFVAQYLDPSPAFVMCCLCVKSRSKLSKNWDNKTLLALHGEDKNGKLCESCPWIVSVFKKTMQGFLWIKWKSRNCLFEVFRNFHHINRI